MGTKPVKMSVLLSAKITSHKEAIARTHKHMRDGILDRDSGAVRIRISSHRIRQLKKDLARELAREARAA